MAVIKLSQYYNIVQVYICDSSEELLYLFRHLITSIKRIDLECTWIEIGTTTVKTKTL